MLLEPEADGVRVHGFEEISIRWLFGLSRFVERRFMQREFERVWNIGWHRRIGSPHLGYANPKGLDPEDFAPSAKSDDRRPEVLPSRAK